MNTTKQSCLGTALFSTALLGVAVAAAPATKPNIVLILADDLGYTDVACFGSKYYSQAEGVMFWGLG